MSTSPGSHDHDPWILLARQRSLCFMGLGTFERNPFWLRLRAGPSVRSHAGGYVSAHSSWAAG